MMMMRGVLEASSTRPVAFRVVVIISSAPLACAHEISFIK